MAEEKMSMRMDDVQAIVADWHTRTFEGRRPWATAKKGLEEAAELFVAAKPNPQGVVDFNRVQEECADVCIVLFSLAKMGAFSLEEAVRAKVRILEERAGEQKARDAERGIT